MKHREPEKSYICSRSHSGAKIQIQPLIIMTLLLMLQATAFQRNIPFHTSTVYRLNNVLHIDSSFEIYVDTIIINIIIIVVFVVFFFQEITKVI